MNILMINQPIGNKGDESAHKGLLRRVLKDFPSAKITVLFCHLSVESIENFKLHDDRINYVNIPRAHFYEIIYKTALKKGVYWGWYLFPTTRKLLSFFKKCDFVLNAPGGICMGGFQVWEHLMFLKMAQLCKKDIYYYGRSFGPFPTETKDNIRFKELSINFLKSFKFLSIRDKKTEALANTLNLNYISTVDSAFLDDINCNIPIDIKKKISSDNYMVFVPNSLVWHYAYKNVSKKQVMDFYLTIVNQINKLYGDIKIVMLPQLFNSPSSDYNYFLEIKALLNNKNIVVIEDTYSSDVQQMVIKNAKFVIGARYHSVVFSINQNKPFIALSYEHKISGLLQTLGLEKFMVEISNIWESKKETEICLLKIENLQKKLSQEKVSNQYAKSISNACFKKFANLIKN